MKKHLTILALAAALAVSVTAPAFAGRWVQDETTGLWHYDVKGRGVPEGFIRGEWAWIDGNYDGVSECYCFDENGNMLADTIKDGYEINASGQWTVNGIVQEKREGVSDTSGKTAVDLIAAGPKESNYMTAFDSMETATGHTFNSGFCLSGDLSHAAYVVYELKGTDNPETVTITFAPKAGQTTKQEARIAVSGLTSGKSLYRSPKFRADAQPIHVTFNVKNESAIRISVVRGFDVLFDIVELR